MEQYIDKEKVVTEIEEKWKYDQGFSNRRGNKGVSILQKENKGMNILITLRKELIEKILAGDKKYEMRKCLPRNMELGSDGFFIVQKGTDEVRCWCRVDGIIEVNMDELMAEHYSKDLCVTPQFILNYAPVGTKVYLWEVSKVLKLQDLSRDSLFVDKNPQQFAYCPLSYGESY